MINTDECLGSTSRVVDWAEWHLRSTEQPQLAHDQVHVWLADLESLSDSGTGETILSVDEQERADRFRFARDRKYFTASRFLLRMLLSSYVGAKPAELHFRYSSHGKPSLGNDYHGGEIQFNLSHSGKKALFAFVRGHEIGIDVEMIRTDIEAETLAQRFFSEGERNELAQVPPAGKHDAFFRCWTRKEAFVKAKGHGLSFPLDRFDVSLAGDSAQLLATRPDGKERDRWWMSTLDVGSEYAAALVVESPAMEIAKYQLCTGSLDSDLNSNLDLSKESQESGGS
jgi:4'-phosphopantetheinyl transferase